MNEQKADSQPTLVEKWIQDQQEWHKMAMEYFDSMVKNDDFLVHLGNAMRGSLLAGKPYPGTERPEPADEPVAADDRLDEILHALHRLQGEVADLKMTLADLTAAQSAKPAKAAKSSKSGKPATSAKPAIPAKSAKSAGAAAATTTTGPGTVAEPAPSAPTPGTQDRE